MIRKEKLIRDQIPQLVDLPKEALRSTKNDAEFLGFLEDKLEEEVTEFLVSRDLEELADILEVIEEFGRYLGSSWEELLLVRDKKRKLHGSFSRRLILRLDRENK